MSTIPMSGQTATSQSGKWLLEGYDTFEGGPDAYYPLPGQYTSEAEARTAAKAYFAELEKDQPSKSSGGQEHYGIQDRVYIVDPNGRRQRVFP